MIRLRDVKGFKKMEGGRGGWSEWVYPEPKGYLMKCCDCGLVHELQFKAFVEVDRRGKQFKIVDLPGVFRAMFRARRAKK